eukprot:gene4774-34532_t
MSKDKAYEALCKRLKELSALISVNVLLEWDQMVIMPKEGSGARGAQKSAIAGVLHDKRTAPELHDLLLQLKEHEGDLSKVEAAVVRVAGDEYQRHSSFPKLLAQRIAQLESDGYDMWLKAKEAKDFSIFAPVLKEWVDVLRQKAAAIDPSKPVYDVLLNEWEKGMTSARVDEVFDQVGKDLVPLIQDITHRGTAPDNSWLKTEFNEDTQAKLCKEVSVDLGFQLSKGRLDVSAHPMTCALHPNDVRMTTRYKSHDLAEGLTGAIHEAGHSLYEQGRNLALDGLLVDQPLSMGVHESQSLLYERLVGLSLPFCRFLLPKLQAAFPKEFSGRSAEELHAAFNVMKVPSMVRTESDEVTYAMHIILRYEIERDLLHGHMSVEEVPGVWKAKMQEYLGCVPADDAEGCLQDLHWACGYTAYFPTYTLGAMYASQIYHHVGMQIPELDTQLAAGEFGPLREWLKEAVHQKGSLYKSADELLLKVTGATLDPTIYTRYLRDKYYKLYKIEG